VNTDFSHHHRANLREKHADDHIEFFQPLNVSRSSIIYSIALATTPTKQPTPARIIKITSNLPAEVTDGDHRTQTVETVDTMK
jgi:hypothetical protein